MITIAVLISDLVWSLFTIGGCSWLVFARGESGWWFVLAVCFWAGGMQTIEKQARSS